MKKATVIFGFLAAILAVLSVFFKIFHLPGASVMMIAGIGFFLLIFLVLLTIQKVKSATLRAEKFMHVIKNLALMDLAVGVLFSLMHYPGSLLMFLVGCVVFIIIYLPLSYKVHKEKHPDENHINKIIMSFIIIVLVFAYGNRNTLSGIFDSISKQDAQVTNLTTTTDSSMVQLMKDFELNKSQFPGQVSPAYHKAMQIQNLSDSLVEFLNTCKKEVAALCGNETIEGLSLAELKGLDEYKDPSNYFCGTAVDDPNGKALEIRKRIEATNDSINSIMKPDSGVVLSIPIAMNSYKFKDTGEEISWEYGTFYHSMLITDLSYLDVLITAVRQTEKDLVSSLLSDARADAMWTFWNKYKALRPNEKTE